MACNTSSNSLSKQHGKVRVSDLCTHLHQKVGKLHSNKKSLKLVQSALRRICKFATEAVLNAAHVSTKSEAQQHTPSEPVHMPQLIALARASRLCLSSAATQAAQVRALTRGAGEWCLATCASRAVTSGRRCGTRTALSNNQGVGLVQRWAHGHHDHSKNIIGRDDGSAARRDDWWEERPPVYVQNSTTRSIPCTPRESS